METPLPMEKLSMTEKPWDKDESDDTNKWGNPLLMPMYRPYLYLDGRIDCFMIVDKELRDHNIIPCANLVLDDYNRQNNTDYKLHRCDDVSLLKKWVGHFRVHCNFVAKAEGEIRRKYFFAEAEFKDGSCTIISYDLLKYGEIKFGCEMCSKAIAHPAS